MLVVAAFLLPEEGWGPWFARHFKDWGVAAKAGGWPRDFLYAGSRGGAAALRQLDR
ncbi:MAG: hypothetical protein U0231_16315 [Nitrospiraceae bacterium]